MATHEKCPRCSGVGAGFALVNAPHGDSGMREITCDICGGSGRVLVAIAILIRMGEQRRKERLARGMTLRKEAERLGISPTELSNIENGRTE